MSPEDHSRVVEAAKTFCPCCMVPYGYGPCAHRPPFDIDAAVTELIRLHGPEGARFKLLATIHRIAAEEERKQRVRNAQHALRYRQAARAVSGQETP